MTNPNDIRSTDDASALRRSTDPEANPVIGSAVDDPDLRDTEIDESAGPAIESLSRGELLRRRFLRNPSAWACLLYTSPSPRD